jgi:hypothetical protein
MIIVLQIQEMAGSYWGFRKKGKYKRISILITARARRRPEQEREMEC